MRNLNNKKIALFMGMVESGFEKSNLFNPTTKEEFKVPLLRYDLSWEWLMPIVKKITNDEMLIGNEHRENILDVIPYVNIEDSYDSVLRFINWHNEHNCPITLATITKKKFIEYLFEYGSDQENEEGISILGKEVARKLKNGDVYVSVSDLWRNTDKDLIPAMFFNEFSDDNTDEISEYENIKTIALI